MELRALRYFLAVAQEENITRAAEFLHVTQPTLSRMIMELEDEFGKQLVIRGKRKISLTPDGVLLRKRARELVELADKAEAELTSDVGGISGDIYIGSGETDVVRFLSETAAELRKAHPGIRLKVMSGDGDDVKERLDKGLVDLGFVFGPVDENKYGRFELKPADRWGVLMPKDWPLAAKDTVSPSDLWEVPLIISKQATDTGFLQSWLGRELNDLNISATYTMFLNAEKMVEGGLGCALMLDGIFNTAGTDLVFRPCEPPLTASVSLIWKKYQTFSAATEAYLAAIRERFG